jgi:hypothetical protein
MADPETQRMVAARRADYERLRAAYGEGPGSPAIRARESLEAAERVAKRREEREDAEVARLRTDVDLARLGYRRQWVTGRVVPVKGSRRNRAYRRRPPGTASRARGRPRGRSSRRGGRP